MKKIIYLLLFFVFHFRCFAQQTGMPFITNYPPNIYKAETQNWAILQDKRGVLFFGNNSGVLEYDGLTWRLIKTPSVVRSLAMDSTGRIFVGIRGDFGYLHPDSLGRYQYLSLKEKIPSQHREFTTVRDIYIAGNRIFFQSYEKVFIMQNENIKVLYPKQRFHTSFLVNQSFYVRDPGQGLMTYLNDSLQLIAGGEQFANEKIYAMLPYGQNDILIATPTQGLWIYSPQQNNRFYKPSCFEAMDKFLIQNLVYSGIVLPNGSFALGTFTGGIVIFNAEGNIQTIYNTNNGLQENGINNMYSDKNKQLWAVSDNGISLVQNNLPFRRFTEKNGLKGLPVCIDVFNNRLYVGTMQYLCVQNTDGNFETITGSESPTWHMYKTKETMLLAHETGWVELKGKQTIPLIKSSGFYSLCPLKNKPDYLLVGLSTGFFLLEYNQKTWKIKNTIKGFAKHAFKTVQDEEGGFWVYTNSELYKLKLNENLDSAVFVMPCTPKEGLPTTNSVPFLLNSGEIVFGTEKGIYRYLATTNAFEPHPDFNMLTNKIARFKQQENGDIWFQETKRNGMYETGVLKYEKGKYQMYKQAFYKFNEELIPHFNGFYAASDSAVFIGTAKGLLQYNPLQKVDYNIPFHTLIRLVFAKDSLLFGGVSTNFNASENIKGVVLPYQQNNIVFHYAATYYEDVEKNLYSYRLIGLDTTWSAWVSDTKKEYTNLNEGEYNFEVKSKNQYEVIGKTAFYSFRILPPWYRTWWAYSLNGILAGLGIFGIVRLNTRRLKQDKIHLEGIIKQRTAEIMQQKEEIETQAENLKIVNAEITQQKEEIETQAENLRDANEYITLQKDELEKHFNNMSVIVQIGQEITASLNLENIIDKVYQHVNSLMDATEFGIGLYHPESQTIDFKLYILEGKRLYGLSSPIHAERFSTWVIKNKKAIWLHDIQYEYKAFIPSLSAYDTSDLLSSLICLPLMVENRVIGIISVQSRKKEAYNTYHFDMIQALSAYVSIALDNSNAYLLLHDSNVLLEEKVKHRTEQIKLAFNELLLAHQQLDNLTYRSAHDLRGPIARLRGLCYIAKLDNRAVDLYLEKIWEEANKMDNLLNRIMLTQSIKTQKENPQDVLVGNVIDGILKKFAPMASGKNIEIRLFKKKECTIQSDAMLVEYLFHCVIENAFRFYDEKSSQSFVEITIDDEGENEISVHVVDNGLGVPPEGRKRIFDMFYVGHDNVQGYGLGLFDAAIIADKLKGRIWLAERTDKLTEFVIVLPKSAVFLHWVQMIS